MSKLLWAILILVLALLLVAAAIGFLVSGPTAPIPVGNLAEQLNAAHADLAENAAQAYKQAQVAMVARMPSVLQLDRIPFDDEMHQLASDWVDANGEALALTLQATELSGFWIDFALDDLMGGSRVDSELRGLARLLAAAGWLALADDDLETAAHTAAALDAMGRQIAQMPTVIDQLVAIAVRALAQDVILAAADTVAMDAAEFEAFVATVEPCFAEPNTFVAALQTEAGLLVQMYSTTAGGGGAAGFWMRLVAPPARVAGEMQQVIAPMQALLAQPADRWTDPNDSNWIMLQRRSVAPVSRSNIAGTLASIVMPSYLEFLPLASRLVATQRGHWTVLQILRFEHEHGALPRLLIELPPSERIIDPFSGRPFVYRTDDNETFTLYSCGLDRDDDGGVHDTRWGRDQGTRVVPLPPDGDFVFWPPDSVRR